jgi:hypothetical protein
MHIITEIYLASIRFDPPGSRSPGTERDSFRFRVLELSRGLLTVMVSGC